MEAVVTGVGDAFTARRFGSSAAVRGPAGYLQIDCPDLIHRAWKAAADRSGWSDLASAQIDDVIITHLHGDHCNGLESFGFHRWFMRKLGRSDVTPRLHATRPVLDRVWERLAPAMDGATQPGPDRTLEDFFEPRELVPGQTASIAGFAVECRFTGHPIPTIGLKLSDGVRTFGWSGDTPFEDAHIEWLSDADLIVHECNLGPAHTPIESLNTLPDDLRAKMRLIHLPDDFDRSTTDITPLEEGEVLRP